MTHLSIGDKQMKIKSPAFGFQETKCIYDEKQIVRKVRVQTPIDNLNGTEADEK
jgi:hypothetical protein